MAALNLNQKQILMIAPKFFGYEAMIMAELQRQGATVHLIYENMNDANVVYRAIPRQHSQPENAFCGTLLF